MLVDYCQFIRIRHSKIDIRHLKYDLRQKPGKHQDRYRENRR